MRFSLATIALIGNTLFSVNGAPTGLSHREARLDIQNSLAERAFVPPKVPHPEPEPVPGPSVPKPGPKPIDPVPVTPHPIDPVTGAPSTKPADDLDPAIPKTYAPKDVPEFGTGPGQFPYTIAKSKVQPGEEDAPDAKWGTSYDVTSTNGYANGQDAVDKIGVNTETNTLSVFGAYNKNDNPGLGKKLYLSDVMMSVFKQQGKNPTDLEAVHVDAVINDSSTKVFDDIYEGLNKNREVDTVTFSATDADKTNFNKIAGTPFGLAIDRANQEFSTGKTAQSYTISPNEQYSNRESDLDVVLG